MLDEARPLYFVGMYAATPPAQRHRIRDCILVSAGGSHSCGCGDQSERTLRRSLSPGPVKLPESTPLLQPLVTKLGISTVTDTPGPYRRGDFGERTDAKPTQIGKDSDQFHRFGAIPQ